MSIILNHVNYIYEDSAEKIKALSDISLELGEGEFVGIIGHTGSGKSTLVQLLNGLLKATSGEIYYNGQNIYDKDFDMIALRRKVGLCFQYPEYQLFETDVFTDVCFGPKNMKLSKEEYEDRAARALSLVELPDECWYASPFELSGGQKKKAAIAGVLALEPEVLVLDEPTAGLDPKGREEILTMISRLQKERGITIVLVSHSMDDVAEYVDRLIVMDKGQILMNDIPRVVFKQSEKLEEIGLSAPQVTYIMKELARGGIKVSAEATTVAEACDEIMRLYK